MLFLPLVFFARAPLSCCSFSRCLLLSFSPFFFSFLPLSAICKLSALDVKNSKVNKRGRPGNWPAERLLQNLQILSARFPSDSLGENMTPKDPFFEGTFWDFAPGCFICSRKIWGGHYTWPFTQSGGRALGSML